MPERLDVTFPSGDGRCVGWLFQARPASLASPCVVMAHGFGATKEARLAAYAERFAAAGIAVLAFDYRHFGLSSGEPPRLIDIGRQHADWRAAVAHARGLDAVDPDRIALWGSSFSGGHVIWVAARDPQVAAVVSQVPHTSGPATIAAVGPRRGAWMARSVLRGWAAALRGDLHEIPLVGAPGSMAIMTSDDAAQKYPGLYPPDHEFVNRVPSRSLMRVGVYSPGRGAARVRCPLLVIVAERDTITPAGPARRAARRAPRGELERFDGRHFDIYRGERFEWAVERETEFLRRSLGIGADAG